MKVKVSEASGPVLDWMAAKCECEEYVAEPGTNGIGIEYEATRYSTDWSQGGPIIEREAICVDRIGQDKWCANVRLINDAPWLYGTTPLIAAMRCFCVSRLGEEVEVPAELLT